MLLAAFSPINGATIEPTVYPGLAFHRVSPNGDYAVSYAYEVIQILDLRKGGDPYAYTDMKVGTGNYVSDTGIVLASGSVNDQAQYWQDGKWLNLTPIGEYAMSFADGITPDGSRIVGSVSPVDFEGYDGQMLVPCYWDRQPDGTYQGPNLITSPNRDFTGEKPQYVTAIYVSDDGKTVAGQMVENRGALSYPIVYKQAEDGSWTYKFLLEHLFTGGDIIAPKSPGEGPEVTDFMSDKEKADYNKAIDAWKILNANSDWPDYGTYPDYDDYMTPEEMKNYEAELTTWYADYKKFESNWLAYIAKVPNIGQNDLIMTGNGETYISSATYKNESGPFVINLKDDSYEFLSQKESAPLVTSVANDGTMLGYSTLWAIRQSYVLPAGQKDFIPIQDYVTSKNPELGKWMQDNMYHQLYGAEWDETYNTFVDHIFDGYATGMAFTNPDFSLLAFAVEDDWNWETSGVITYGYIFSLDAMGSVESIMDQPSDGVFRVFNLQGLKVLETKNPAEINDLPKGIYVVNGKKISI